MQSITPAATEEAGIEERLIRLLTPRRGRVVEFSVHYQVTRRNGCSLYRIITVDEVNESCIPH